MARSTQWPSKSPFFPLGDIAAVCLTSELAPEQPADILLLGCGDTHNILYTVYADLGASSRNLDITCCDLEPAILARNVLLFTLIADMPSESDANEYISNMWNLYHHFFIDKGTFDFLLKQCQKLVDLSSDLASWDNSKYGSFLRFCTTHTLSALRKHWALYVEAENFSDAEKDSLLNKMPTKVNICKSTLRRSAGIVARKLGRMGMKQFYRFWQRGVTFDDSDVDGLAAANQINPTFVYSANGLGFDMDGSCDPLLSFHPAKVLAPIKDSGVTTVTVSTLVKSAMEEFAAWCRAFKERLKPLSSPPVIRFITGDALAFCRALQYFSISNDPNTGIYASAWSSTLINFDGADYTSRCAPLHFNVIDTSNLTDHLGLMNMLIACRPLMRREPSSVLHTNTLYRFNMIERVVGSGGFLDRLCGDISILSLILDIVPVSYVSDFKTHSNTHEMYMEIEAGLHKSFSADASFFIKQFYERIYWRITSISDSEIVELLSGTPRLKFDERQLATFLCAVYMDMFSEEKLVETAVWESKELSDMKKYSKGQYYVRSSFVYLLRVIRSQLHIDWESFQAHLDELIFNDCKLHVFGPTNLVDYFCSLHLAGFRTLKPLSENLSNYYKQDLFEGWDDIPPTVCVTLQVPKEALIALEEFVDNNELGTLPLVCSLWNEEDDQSSYCGDFQSFFASIDVDYSTPEPIITINEDAKGIHGSSPIIFSFYIQTAMLAHCPSVTITPQVNLDSFAWKDVLGPKLVIFSGEITDKNHVHITRERPGNQGELQKLRAVSNVPLASSTTTLLSDCVKISLDSTSHKVETLTS